MTTEITDPLGSSIPVASGEIALWAPEVGQYQGASYLTRLRRSYRTLPGLYRGTGASTFEDLHTGVSEVGPLGNPQNFRLIRLPAF